MTNVIIADDHPLMRGGVKKAFSDEPDIAVVNEAQNGSELLAILKNVKPDILIMDLDMPGKSGIDLLKHIKQIYPRIPVLILSVHPAEHYAVRALKAGAMGYLNKKHVETELLEAVRKIIYQKRRYIPPDVGEQLALQVDTSHIIPHKNLSDREYEVLCKLAKGMNVKSIAGELSLSIYTIYTYRGRIKEKMGLKSNVEITRYAMEHDLID
jgi:DNA-binding NarL/FixJ family response regulator